MAGTQEYLEREWAAFKRVVLSAGSAERMADLRILGRIIVKDLVENEQIQLTDLVKE